MGILYKFLSNDGRIEEFARSVDDIEYREKLFLEYGIKKKDTNRVQ